MTTWYTVDDISLGYRLSAADLRLLVKHGDLWSIVCSRESDSGKMWKTGLIPMRELRKLKNYRDGVPRYDSSHQLRRFITHHCDIEPPELDTSIRREFASRDDYMKSYEWLRVRMIVMKRDGYRCVKCGGQDRLCVHHLTYARLYHERLEDLQTLCARCHYLAHFT